MKTVTVPVELLEQLVMMNKAEEEAMAKIGFGSMVEYYKGRGSAYQWILDNYPHE